MLIVDKLGKKLADGYRKTIAKVGLQSLHRHKPERTALLMCIPKKFANYRDWTTIDIDLWRPLLVRHGKPRR